jgi:hypothetical protein
MVLPTPPRILSVPTHACFVCAQPTRLKYNIFFSKLCTSATPCPPAHQYRTASTTIEYSMTCFQTLVHTRHDFPFVTPIPKEKSQRSLKEEGKKRHKMKATMTRKEKERKTTGNGNPKDTRPLCKGAFGTDLFLGWLNGSIVRLAVVSWAGSDADIPERRCTM